MLLRVYRGIKKDFISSIPNITGRQQTRYIRKGTVSMNEQNPSMTITQRILLSKDSMSWCVNCNRRLIGGVAHIPRNSSQFETFPGLECPKCHMVYLRKNDTLIRKLTDSSYIITNELHGKTEWKYVQKMPEFSAKSKNTGIQNPFSALKLPVPDHKAQEASGKRKQRCEMLLSRIMSSQFCIVLRDEKGMETDVVIVLYKSYADIKHNILYCHWPEAKELMTHAFHAGVSGQSFDYRGKSVSITEVVYHPKKDKRGILFPKRILLRKGGGYYNEEKPDAILATAMFYSPFTGSYEPLMVSYDEKEQNYFVDPAKFRDFLHSKGNPELPIAVHKTENGKYSFDFGDLNEQSFLTGYGYNVNAGENLSRKTRHEMLTELVDLGIAHPWEIVNHLRWCIHTFSAPKYQNARDKWEEDAEYISQYKANPERFLIASQVNR